ncbi:MULTISPECIES: cell division protein ZapE [Brucella/Ochrobactrum group]|uniref:ATPase component BioM of energizing module of biotin ECF transporter n=2 Tax=Ochrobactrum TaxID=528 RepID=A0A2P9HRB7_9HYPH|nr:MULTISPECIES: cell division protein ZapE [Brucella]MCI0998492.1 AFG1 family ATPase [Ochrobactrum sp. C6C9]RRD27573.1 cell division protein ZapE [Brucellaceae bacterium VT-16-1752]WHT41578.1 cell division protein ZapE [Ochrobactrum sp. SSR]MDX4075250.1 cell division protein ZapE [Brucella sp. NBRC 113783]NNU59309.1 cell division protein ZapE [[Ochrobactrum] soli]
MSFDGNLKAFPSVREHYDAMVASGDVEADPAQLQLTDRYDRLIEEICTKRLSRKSSALGWLFGKRKQAQEIVKGLYVHGEVGRGKTMLMDMFFQLLPVERKRRAHFNDFMADVHDRINAHRQALKRGETKQDDPIPPVADALSAQAWVLCFDEFTVTDIADAMILSRLFSALFARGVVLIATSNVAPDNLYRDGLNRQLFLPFVDILKKHVDVINLDSRTDYRLEKLDLQPVYLAPLGGETAKRMDAAWAAQKDGMEERPDAIRIKGRDVEVPRAVPGAARFSFEELCSRPLGATDYLAIVGRYSTLFIDNVPMLDLSRRNEAKRFILLVDVLYDHHARVFITAEAQPEKLYVAKSGTEAFEFDRTASRLFEMQSAEYLSQIPENAG